jgi:hypothetical protein
MNSKAGVAFSVAAIAAIAAVIVLIASGPLAATQAHAFPFGGFHHGFGFHHFHLHY